MYYILVVESCEPHTVKKQTKKEVKAYLQGFIDKHGSLDDKADNWIDQIFKGKKIQINTIVQVKD